MMVRNVYVGRDNVTEDLRMMKKNRVIDIVIFLENDVGLIAIVSNFG